MSKRGEKVTVIVKDKAKPKTGPAKQPKQSMPNVAHMVKTEVDRAVSKIKHDKPRVSRQLKDTAKCLLSPDHVLAIGEPTVGVRGFGGDVTGVFKMESEIQVTIPDTSVIGDLPTFGFSNGWQYGLATSGIVVVLFPNISAGNVSAPALGAWAPLLDVYTNMGDSTTCNWILTAPGVVPSLVYDNAGDYSVPTGVWTSFGATVNGALFETLNSDGIKYRVNGGFCKLEYPVTVTTALVAEPFISDTGTESAFNYTEWAANPSTITTSINGNVTDLFYYVDVDKFLSLTRTHGRVVSTTEENGVLVRYMGQVEETQAFGHPTIFEAQAFDQSVVNLAMAAAGAKQKAELLALRADLLRTVVQLQKGAGVDITDLRPALPRAQPVGAMILGETTLPVVGDTVSGFVVRSAVGTASMTLQLTAAVQVEFAANSSLVLEIDDPNPLEDFAAIQEMSRKSALWGGPHSFWDDVWSGIKSVGSKVGGWAIDNADKILPLVAAL